MKSKLFLTVLLLAAITTTIGISQDKDVVPFAKEKAAKAELVRIYKLPVDAQSLVGAKGINVVIETLEEDAKSTGLTQEQLKTDVELKLRLAKIKINSREEMLASKDGTYIYLNVDTTSENDDPSIVYTVSVQFHQQVTLVRSPFATVGGATWDRGNLGIWPKSEFQEKARQIVKDHMDKFLNDYLTANPKE